MGEVSAPHFASRVSSQPGPLRVLVVGSFNHPKRPVERRQFETACRHLGAALARRGLTPVVSSLHPSTADIHVLKGANDAREGKTPLPVILLPPTTPRSNDPLYPENEQQFNADYPNLALTLEMLPGEWKEIRQAQANNAEVVVLIGGREGTRQVAWAANERGVPILPIRIFGRAAKHLWEIERANLAAHGQFEDCEEFSRLYDRFNADHIADLALRLAQKKTVAPTSRAARTKP
ncbi:MAG: hypothetical protein HY735_17980 [Verrucomicrobia bacterium]|nr:hypothetical protein [Verrucomicrobiota bacterium]